MESDTPRTDAENYIYDIGQVRWVSIEFARKLERELAAAKAELVRNADELAAAIKQRDEAKSDFSDAWRERSEFAKRIDEADAALANVLQALQKAHDAMVLAKTSHGCFLACDPPLDAWKDRCVDAHLGDAIRECAAAMRKGEA